MNFADLIKSLTDYLDLGKRVANTLPGLVMALGLAFFVGAPPDFLLPKLANDQFNVASEKLAKARKQKADLEVLKASYDQEKTNLDSLVQGATSDLNNLRSTLCAKGCVPKPPSVLEAENAITDLHMKQLAPLAGKLVDVESNIAVEQTEIAKLEQDLKTLQQRLSIRGEFTTSITAAFNVILLFGLLGFALGTVADPVNKALFLGVLPKSLWVPAPLKNLATSLKLHGRFIPEKIEAPTVPDQPIQYFIGRGYISQQEYDGLVSQYYRYAEITVGMILPVIVLAAGCCYFYVSRHNLQKDPWVWAAFMMPTLLGSYVLLYRTGLRRYYEFQRQVVSFVKGKEELYEESLKRQQSTVDLTTLSQLIHSSKKLLQDIQHTEHRDT